jgi:hypothetical protein
MTQPKRSAEEWKTLIEEHETSGKSQQAFVREKKIVLSSFQYWRRRLEKEVSADDFVVVKAPVKRPGGALRIELANGIKVEVSGLDGLDEILRILVGL